MVFVVDFSDVFEQEFGAKGGAAALDPAPEDAGGHISHGASLAHHGQAERGKERNREGVRLRSPRSKGLRRERGFPTHALLVKPNRPKGVFGGELQIPRSLKYMNPCRLIARHNHLHWNRASVILSTHIPNVSRGRGGGG